MELAILIARIILLILGGASAMGAVSRVAEESGASIGELWDQLPDNYK